MAEHPDTRARLEERFPFAAVLAPPTRMQCRFTSFVKRLKIKCLIALGGLEHVDRAFVAALRRRAASIVVVAMPGHAIVPEAAGSIFMDPERHRQVDQFVVGEAAMAERLRAAGVAAENIQVVSGLAEPDGIRSRAVSHMVESLKPFLAQHGSLMRSQRRRSGLRLGAAMAGAMESGVVRRLLSSRIQRLETIEDLRRALGEPRTILCLGNGPSSEDRALGEMAHDSLFRVNHRWLERGFLVKPDIVFTGSDKTLAAVQGTMFGLSSIEIETMLLRKWLLRRPFRRLNTFSPERAGVLPVCPAGASRPTNGVIMLATAVALRPNRLIVAGLDLFQDPKGAYPGDPITPNAYAAAHERSMELRLILEILGRYRGELVIVGDVLRRHWEAHSRGGGIAPE